MLFALGAYHGLNPAMGWLFAVALGLQEKNGRAVLKSLLPLGAGHLLSVGVVVALAQLAQLTLPLYVLKVVAATLLIGFAVYKLIRRRHPRWVGMRVGARDLTFWSFLMASAHGAGLMLLPFILRHSQPAIANTHEHHVMMSSLAGSGSVLTSSWWLPVGMHTLGYLLVTALLALVVYHKMGLAILRRAWFNLELLWIGALFCSGVLTLLI